MLGTLMISLGDFPLPGLVSHSCILHDGDFLDIYFSSQMLLLQEAIIVYIT
jgi:hypothetical protein